MNGRSLVAVIAATWAAAAPIAAQRDSGMAAGIRARRDSSTVQDSASRPHLFTTSTAIVGGAFIAAAAIAAPFDQRTSTGLRAGWLQHDRGLRNVANALDAGIGSGSILISAGVYASGILAHDRPLAGVGIDLGEAVGAAGVTSEILKWVTGRARPTQRPNDPADWGFGRGLSHDGYASFPSATTTLAFALASAASVDAARAWPHTRVVLPIIFYSAAAAVGVSRVYRQEHWGSDVVTGAGIGTVAGLLATRFNLLQRQNFIRRWFLPAP